MSRRAVLFAALVGIPALAIGSGISAAADEPPAATTPATQQVLLGAPDPAGPTVRGTFVSDPEGQIERVDGLGHLVAWTVRSPAFRGPGGPSDPQLAIRSCMARKQASYTIEVLALTPEAPVTLPHDGNFQCVRPCNSRW